MSVGKALFDEELTLRKLVHYLPFQSALKDFVAQNLLMAFQSFKFYDGINTASHVFGYRTTLSIDEFRSLYQSKKIRENVLDNIIAKRKGVANVDAWKKIVLTKTYNTQIASQIGKLRAIWKDEYCINLDKIIHPFLFRFTASYLDQGIAMQKFPVSNKSFLATIREIEKHSASSFFKTKRAKAFLLNENYTLVDLLKIVVGEEHFFEQYLFDQQFAHPGISGFVGVVERQPETLLDHKIISLHDFIYFELLLELDALDNKFGETWKPVCLNLKFPPTKLFENIHKDELFEVLSIWQDAFEWSHYDEVLCGIKQSTDNQKDNNNSFQAVLCIDDREYSLRRHIENSDANSQTYGAPGFFGIEFYFQPESGKFYTRACPLQVTPKFLIKEEARKNFRKTDVHYTKRSNSPIQGLIISQTLGFWSAFKLLVNIFKPTVTAATALSFQHMDKHSQLSIETKNETFDGLQIGFTFQEMALRVGNILRMIGLVDNFAPIVYMVGHGASSVNNTHYAAYDCGACSGRPGAVNARVFAHMANHPKVRELLRYEGIMIPDETQFIGALHDTTRDEIEFYDESPLSLKNMALHKQHVKTFMQALSLNAKERSRRFEMVNTKLPLKKLHELIKLRSVSLYEPRAELTHTNNSMCIIGRGSLTKHLFLDRRPFMNSYDYSIDPEGKLLLTILNTAAPMCGGINLMYYFSRVDNQKLGAGTKLPHNVIGLFGVSNGIDGDLRPGLPSQMVDLHDPVRILFIIEHYPEVVLNTIKINPAVYEWFINEWVHLVVKNPKDNELYLFEDGAYTVYRPLQTSLQKVNDVMPFIENYQGNIPVLITN